MYYPRVLIIGQSFHEISGSGITLTNLFKDWPQEAISVAAPNIDQDFIVKNRPCKYVLCLNAQKNSNIKTNSAISIKTKFRRAVGQILRTYTGYSDIFSKKHIPNQLIELIDSFHPEIIYTALGSLPAIEFMLKLKSLRNIPIAIHIWDDWPATLFERRICRNYWAKKYDRRFRKLITQASGLFSICETMSDEYIERYGVNFIPFHNPVDPRLWESVPFNTNQKSKRIIYVGKINKDTEKNLITMCKVVHKLIIEGYNIKFEVYTPNNSGEKVKVFSKYKNCYVYNAIPQNEIPQLLRSASILFLTLGFDKHSFNYTRLSMPTKLTEYFISKVPILLYCPKEIALYKYCTNNNCALWSDKGTNNLYTALKSLITKPELCKYISNNAYTLVVDKHSSTRVRENFRKALIKAIHN